MRILISVLLTAALISFVNSPADLNNSEQRHNKQVVQAEAPRKEPTLPKEQEKAQTERQVVSEPEPVVNVQPSVKAAEPEPQKAPTCASEVTRYNWNTTVAHNVMMAESDNKPNELNPDASTDDYSVGCFQINLRGTSNLNAKYRDSVRAGYTGPKTVSSLEQWLKNAHNNVAVAYIMWQDQKWIPWSNYTCKVKVRCY